MSGALDSSVTLDELLNVVISKRVPLAPELAGYLVLEIAEHADPNGGDVDSQSVYVGEEGTVALVKPKRERPRGDAETSVRAILAKLIEASGSQTPALTAASKRPTGPGLRSLADELEAALIPVNRAAGRRALARLAREVRRVTLGVGRHTLQSSPFLRSASDGSAASQRAPHSAAHAPGEPPSARPAGRPALDEDATTTRSRVPSDVMKHATPAHWSEIPTSQFPSDGRGRQASETDVDTLIEKFGVSEETAQHARALKAMAGLEPTPIAPSRDVAEREPAHAPHESDVEALLASSSEPLPPLPPPPKPPRFGAAQPAVAKPAPGRQSPAGQEQRQLPTQPSQLKRPRPTLPSTPRLKPKGGSWLAAIAVIAVGVGLYAAWRFQWMTIAAHTASAPGAPSITAVREPASACVGSLVVSDVPTHAEVLLRQGQAPVDVPRMPVGARLEFVATAEGYVPKRVVIPAGAGWDTGPDGKPRFEAAVQLDPSRARSATNDPWPPGEPGSSVGGEGPPGTVRVVATPRGAEVWMLGGIGPEARIDHLRCDQDIDVLLAGPTTYRKRLHVRASDFGAEENAAGGAKEKKGRVARISAK